HYLPPHRSPLSLHDALPIWGRFRSFLRTVCAHFLANRRDWEHTRKRGGGRTILSIAAGAEGQYARELADGLTPERIFDRSWALTDRKSTRLNSSHQIISYAV